MSLQWSEIGSLEAEGYVVRVTAGLSENPDTGRIGISFASNNMTSYIEVDSMRLQDVIELLADASKRVSARSYQHPPQQE